MISIKIGSSDDREPVPDKGGNVTIRWIGTTYGGNAVELARLVIEGDIDDDVTHLVALPDSIDSVWKLQSHDLPDSIIVSAAPQAYAYQYVEVPDFSVIVVENTSMDGVLDFVYQVTKKLTDEVFTITAFNIPTFRVTGYVLYDNAGNETKFGMGDIVMIDPANGSQRIVFLYESTITSVVIRAVDALDQGNILQIKTVADAPVGQRYAAVSPYIDSSWVLMEDILQVVDVEPGTNYVTFEYIKTTGNVTVLLKENDADGPIIQARVETVPLGGKTTIPIPDLSEAYYTPVCTQGMTVDYTGSSPMPQTVSYYYRKEMMDVTIRAIDESDDSVLTEISYANAARKGEPYMATATAAEWYSLTEPSSKTVYADPNAADNTLVIDFDYQKDDVSDIMVRCFYQDEDGSNVNLQTYTVKNVVGSKFFALADTFDGFSLIGDDFIGLVVNADAEKNVIAFAYADVRKTVSVFTQVGADQATRQRVSSDKYISGSETTVIPPYMHKHLVKGYIIEEAMTNIVPDDFTGLAFMGNDAVTSDVRVVFVYVPVDGKEENRALCM